MKNKNLWQIASNYEQGIVQYRETAFHSIHVYVLF